MKRQAQGGAGSLCARKWPGWTGMQEPESDIYTLPILLHLPLQEVGKAHIPGEVFRAQ